MIIVILAQLFARHSYDVVIGCSRLQNLAILKLESIVSCLLVVCVLACFPFSILIKSYLSHEILPYKPRRLMHRLRKIHS